MRRSIALAVAAVLSGTTMTLAQSAPAPTGLTPTPAPVAQTPYWDGSGQAAPTESPAIDIRAVPPAHANAVRAHWTFEQGLFDLNNAVRLVRARLDRTPDYVKAVADARAAYDVAEAARTQALATLDENPAYVGARTLHRNVSAQIADEQFAEKPDAARLSAMAKLKLQYVQDNRKLEASALERDPAYQDAKRRSIEAAGRVSDLERDQSMLVATDDSLVALRKQVADARIDKLASQAYYESTIRARNNAVDYAVFSRGIDVYHGYGNGYSPYGGGYGGYGGYGIGLGGYGNGRFVGSAVR